MTREEAIKVLSSYDVNGVWADVDGKSYNAEEQAEAFDMAIGALKAQEWDEVVFDMNEFFSIVDDGKITVMRRGRGRVTVERPAMGMETTICSYGGRSEK